MGRGLRVPRCCGAAVLAGQYGRPVRKARLSLFGIDPVGELGQASLPFRSADQKPRCFALYISICILAALPAFTSTRRCRATLFCTAFGTAATSHGPNRRQQPLTGPQPSPLDPPTLQALSPPERSEAHLRSRSHSPPAILHHRHHRHHFHLTFPVRESTRSPRVRCGYAYLIIPGESPLPATATRLAPAPATSPPASSEASKASKLLSRPPPSPAPATPADSRLQSAPQPISPHRARIDRPLLTLLPAQVPCRQASRRKHRYVPSTTLNLSITHPYQPPPWVAE